MSDFQSLLSVFQDATGSAPPSSKNNNNNNNNNSGQSTSSKTKVDLDSTTDPNFSSSLMKQRIERVLRIQQIRKSTNKSSSSVNSSSNSAVVEGGGQNTTTTNVSQKSSSSFHLAICATIVDDFPHEELWKRWMASTTIDIPNDYNSSNVIPCSAELYIHAKYPQHIHSTFLQSKLLPFSHVPNWNDVRVIRAMLSLLQRALQNEQTTHVVFCTESCIPVVTLGEAARSILVNEVCTWEETKEDAHPAVAGVDAAATTTTTTTTTKTGDHDRKKENLSQPYPQINWNRSYIHHYNQNSPQCTRFDEHNCWSILSNSIPSYIIHKALPGWCLLSRKHAQSILELPEKQLGGMNLWPAFERVWAPEEVYFPTALALCGYINGNGSDNSEVSNRSVTHSEWDTRASNHKDRAHPFTYDDKFDYELVKRVRNENGALFMRKLKKELDWNVWEEIVIRRKKGRSSRRSSSRGHYTQREVTSSTMRSGCNDYNRERDRGRGGYRERNDRRHHYDSRQNGYDGHHRDRGDRTRSYEHESSSKRQRWR
jgi:hypothetical protein